MGPSLILDKSAVQSMNDAASYEQYRYFWTNVTPLITLEILGDLKKYKDDQPRAIGAVRALATRVHGLDTHVNMDAKEACINSLLGGVVEMKRVTLIKGAYSVRTKSGKLGAYVPHDPVSAALLRWECGAFSEGEALLSEEWRRVNRGIDLEGLKNRLGFPRVPIPTLQGLRDTVDRALCDPNLQVALLDWFLEQIAPPPPIPEWVLHRWRTGGFQFIRQFAPYAHHCLRIELFFSIGLQHGLIGTRATNRLDMEYYWYAPFAQVFSSRDRLHKQLSPFLLEEDQSFADGDQLVAELRGLADRREDARTKHPDDPDGERPLVEPEPGSLIHSLWEKHVPGGFRPQSRRGGSLASEGLSTLPPDLQEMFTAMKEVEKEIPPQPRWPV